MRKETPLSRLLGTGLLSICLLMFFYPRLSAQEKITNSPIHLKWGNVQAPANAFHWLDSMQQTQQNSTVQVLLQFTALPTNDQRLIIQENGIALYDYVPDNAFIALVHFPLNTSNISNIPVYSIIPVNADWKADKYLWQNVLKNINSNVEVLISFYENIDKQTIGSLIQQAGGMVETNNLEELGNYKVVLPAAKLRSIAQWYGVKYIGPVTTNSMLDNTAKDAAKVNVVAAPYALGGNNLLGDSVTVGVGDNTAGLYHIDMVDRVLNYNPAAITPHGIHINGIVGSAGIVDPAAEGTAYHAKLVDHYFDNILAYTGVMNKVHNMTITNNSYVVLEADCNYAGTYDAYSQFVDRLANQYKSILHVFAAGNDGNLTCSPYPFAFATTCGGYQPAKNNLCVTMTDYLYRDAGGPSHGPVKDGRLKPDMSAVGSNVFSCLGINDYLVASGTSMASPGVAGAAALITQRYKQLNGGVSPRADVLKTLILNGTMDLGNPGPDYRFGFGFLDLYRSLNMLNNGYYTTNVVSNGGQKTMIITVPPNTSQLKVMLNWCDAPASPLSQTVLVNDLDLQVIEPSSVVHKPLILNPSPAHVEDNAVENEDHLNNTEQVTINNPAAGDYTLIVLGLNVPSLIQDYTLAYDFIPQGVKLTHPATGSLVPNPTVTNPLYVYWDASNDTNSFTLQYSIDNGNNWNLISNTINPAARLYQWAQPGINSGLCKFKLSRNNTNQQSTSGTFIINTQDTVHLDSIQCPGYMSIYWAPVPNASAYQVLRKKGPYMQVIDTTATNHYVLKGLSLDSLYYVSVAPIINGLAGYRSQAIWYQPNTGNCSGAYSSGDLMLQRILAPGSGRKFTSIQLGNNENLVLQLRNLYTSACNSYILSYKINNGSWLNDTPSVTIPANSSATVSIPGLDLSGTGNYKITVAITNKSLPDPVHQNDTLIENISHFTNDVIDLTNSFNDGFEGMGVATFDNNFIGVSSYWDYSTSTDSGRLRTYVNDSILISGNRSVSLDAILNMSQGNQNYFTGTFNLSNYFASNAEIRTNFDYNLHGIPKTATGNQVWIRGTDTSQWVNLFAYNMAAVPGQVNHSGTLSLSDAMIQHHQNFSSSTQIRFGQNDTSLIALKNYGNGMTLDNFSIYTVQNDMQMVRIISPQQLDCGMGSIDSLTVLVKNGVNIAQHNVWLYYQVDGGTIYTDTLVAIAAKDSVRFTFKKPMNLSALGSHTINVWLSNAGDTYHSNDSIMNYSLHNQPLITAFPYLQDFEASNGYWYTDGVNDSWQYGTPASPKIHKAASGTKAWKTNLTGNYNNLEKSYLYSPCFDVSGLTNPMLSFSFAMQIENCGDALCDAGYIEYATDNIPWTKLGSRGLGTNWYDSSFNVWNEQNNTRWHVASIPLPHSSSPIRLRFVLASDPSTSFEGMAIDDINIFDLVYPVYNAGTAYYIQQSISGSQWLNFTQPNGIFAQVQPYNNSLGDVNTAVYQHSNLANFDKTQYVFPKSFTVKTTQPPTGSVGVRLYILDSDVLNMIYDSSCLSCTKPVDAYSLGISKYDNANTSVENGIMDDNIGGVYTYYPHSTIKWVPYDRGYYAEINLKSFSELWLNDGGPAGNFPIGYDYLAFNARKISATDVKVDWTSFIDTTVKNYVLQRSMDNNVFTVIDSVTALHQPAPQYLYTDAPTVLVGNYVYYRLKWLGLNDSVYYSPVRTVNWTSPNELISIYPNPTNGQFTISWTANTGTEMKISIVDAIGREVLQTGITATEWNMSSTVRTPHFSSGVYFLRIAIADKQYLHKLLYH